MRLILALACALALLTPTAAPVRADEEAPVPLTVGDPAPALDIAHWIKGVEMDPRGGFVPVTTFAPGRVYVIEFWATWCSPCRAGMPHLSEVQERHAEDGVTVIGVSDESLPKVVSFLWQTDADGKVQNDRTRYTLTTDPDRSTHEAYMEASGMQGIPTAFLVGKDGRVEWIGHPMEMDQPLAQVVAGTWDRAAFKAEFEAAQRVERAMQEAQPRLMQAAVQGDWDGVARLLDELLVLAPDSVELKMQKLEVLLTRLDDKERAYAYAEEVAKGIWDEAEALNWLSWMIVDSDEVKHRDLDFALRLAKRADALTLSKDAAILDTLARVHFERGDLEAAIEWQTKAVEAAEGDVKAEFEATLARYRDAHADVVGR